MKKFIFLLLFVSSALFGNNQSSISSFVFDKYFDMGNYYANLKKYDLAIKSYTKAIELNPNDANTYYNRGIAYNKLKNYSSAIKDYTKAIELNPNDADAYNNRGLVYTHLKKDDLAIKDYNKAIELNSNDANAYLGRGYSYSKIKNYELSIKDYKKAIELNPTIIDAYINIFEQQMIIGKKFDKSLEENFVKLFSDDKQAFIYYEIFEILQSINTNQPYVLSLEEWSKKYKDTKLESWNWDYLDEWANATKDNEKKVKLQNAIKVFKEHGEDKK
jgi:tetratricopeptide (TPR) repeat protein